jgi:hypothetical protein
MLVFLLYANQQKKFKIFGIVSFSLHNLRNSVYFSTNFEFKSNLIDSYVKYNNQETNPIKAVSIKLPSKTEIEG